MRDHNFLRFVSLPDPNETVVEELMALTPGNPFTTPAYLRSKVALRFRPWLLGIKSAEGELVAGCLAFLTPNPLIPVLKLPSMPALGPGGPKLFWESVIDFCNKLDLCGLSINTAASPPDKIPRLSGERSRRSRSEYILDLDDENLLGKMSGNHRRNIKRSQKHNITLERSRNEKACREHAQLLNASMERRRNRGESINSQGDFRRTLPYLTQGAGELFRAVSGGQVLSSILVLLSPTGAYYQSAGTNAEGMARGACHFLIYETAKILQAAKKQQFNLGAAEPQNLGLHQFKAGFGTRRVELEAAEIVLGSGIRNDLWDTLRSIRRGCQHLARCLGPLSAGRLF
jgi:hypothetical protein